MSNPYIITTSPLPDGNVGSRYHKFMSANGGTSPYTWSAIGGALPTGLSISTAGLISGTPTAAGVYTATIDVTDSGAGLSDDADFTITIHAAGGTAPSITTSSLPGASTGTAYDQTLTVTGGTAPFAFAITAGALPSGITINIGTGEISGTPTVTGTSSFTVQVTDSASLTGTASLSITVSASASPPSITTSSLPNGALTTAYSQTLGVSGGTAPLAFAITTGALPAGLALDRSAGTITGTPTASGTSSFTVAVTDSLSLSGSASLSITVPAAPVAPVLTLGTLPGAVIGAAYSYTFGVNSGTGTSPFSFAATSGAVPAGLTLNSSTGVLSGTPTAAGYYTFGVTVTDAASLTGTASFTVAVTATLPVALTVITTGAISAMRASGGLAPVLLAEVLTTSGKVYRWSERDLANTSSLLTPGVLPIASIATTSVTRPGVGGHPGSTVYYMVVTLSAAAAIPTGIAVSIAGNSHAAFNTGFQPISVTSPTTFQVSVPAALLGASGTGGTATYTGAPATYQGWIIGQPRFKRSGTVQTDTGSFAIQNYSGNTVTRDAATAFSSVEFINALCICRLWRTDAEVALFTFIGTISEAEMTDAQLDFTLESFGNWSAVPAPVCKIDPTCPLFFGSPECGSTSPTPCQNTYGTCSSFERFKGFLTQWTWANQGIPSQQIAQPAPPVFFNPRRAF